MNTLARNYTAPKPILPVHFDKIYISDPRNLRICNTPQIKRNPRHKPKIIPLQPSFVCLSTGATSTAATPIPQPPPPPQQSNTIYTFEYFP